MALGFGIPGIGLLAADLTARDDDGFLMSEAQSLATPTYAIASTSMDLRIDAPSPFVPEWLLGDAKLTAVSDRETGVFVGIGPTAQVQAYLADVRHATLVDLTNGKPVFRNSDGSAPGSPPDTIDFWVAQESGPGVQGNDVAGRER